MSRLLSFLQNKKIVLIGAGVETLSIGKYLFKNNISVDLIEADKARASELEQFTKNGFYGKECFDNLANYDLVVRSPGFPLEKLKQICIDKKCYAEISSTTKLFVETSPAKIIGVTGTKGKGTTSSLIFEILSLAKKDVYLAGNIGHGVFDFFDKLNENSIVVLELSSFQLEDFTVSPQIAVVLEISPDHLKPLSPISPNFHQNIDDYVKAKSQIIVHQKSEDWAIINIDHPYTDTIIKNIKGNSIQVSQKQELSEGIYISGENIIARGKFKAEIDVAGRKLLGLHNLQNIACACAVGLIEEIENSIIKSAVNNFSGLPHRMQNVAERNNLKFIDDSYATDPAATIAAIKSFHEPLAIILGGSSKGASFNLLANTIVQKGVKFVSLIGSEQNKIAEALTDAGFDNWQTFNNNFDLAIKSATEKLDGSGIVLLSPACASLDMFKNASDRGEQFTKIVIRGVTNGSG